MRDEALRARLKKKYREKDSSGQIKQELWYKGGKAGGPWLGAGITLVEAAKGTSKSRFALQSRIPDGPLLS